MHGSDKYYRFVTNISVKNIYQQSKMKLQATNPDSLEYSNDLMDFTVLGGIRLDGLDRMRVTLKVSLKESSCTPIRHNMDLYNDLQVEKFIRKTAERLEIGTSLISAGLNELTNELESYRLAMIELTREEQFKPRELDPQQKHEAESFLQQSELMQRTGELIGQSGVIGEELNRLLMYIIFTSRKREQPLHVVSLGASGTGKTHLQEKVGSLIPEEDTIEITTLSENAFYYFGQRELKNKLILIEDLDGAENVLYPLRELQSKKRISKTIARKNNKGETRTIHLVVEGPVSVSGCTTKEEIYEDNANRSFLIYLDESKEQDEKIMEYQRKHSAGKIDTESEQKAQELLKNCQRLLKPIKIINPYAERLNIPVEVLKPRRTNTHYLQFIEAVTYYHQLQREQQTDKETGEIFIETTLEDISHANRLLKETLLRKSDELTGAQRNFFEKLKLYLLGSDIKTFTNREISNKLRIPVTTVKRHHLDLYNSGYLKINKKDKYKGFLYEIVSYEEYNQLKSNIINILDNNLKELEKNLSQQKQPNSPHIAQGINGLPKTQKNRVINKPAHEELKMVMST